MFQQNRDRDRGADDGNGAVGGSAKCKMDGNGLTTLTFPSTVSPDALTWLSAQNNQLSSLDGVEQCSRLTVFNASHNVISNIERIGKVTSLCALILAHNSLTNIDAVVNLWLLNTLVVSDNPELTDISAVSSMVSLKKLFASSCALTSLSWKTPESNQLVNLEELRINHNKITKLDAGLAQCKKLKRLAISHNQIRKGKRLIDLVSLTHLEIDGNPVMEDPQFTDQIMDYCPRLLVFNLRPTDKNWKAAKRKQTTEPFSNSNEGQSQEEQEEEVGKTDKTKESRPRKKSKSNESVSAAPVATLKTVNVPSSDEPANEVEKSAQETHEEDIDDGPVFEPNLTKMKELEEAAAGGYARTDAEHSGIVNITTGSKGAKLLPRDLNTVSEFLSTESTVDHW